MKTGKRLWIYCVCIMVIFFSNVNYVEASLSESYIIDNSKVEKESETRDDVIIKYYKIIGMQVYYRRWNETKGYWVDPYWIPV